MSDAMIYLQCQTAVEKGGMKKERPNRRLFNEVMDTRVTVRLDKQHIKVIEQVMNENNFNSMSEAIRFIIKNYQTK